MKYSTVFVVLMSAIGLGACDRQPATAVVAVPGSQSSATCVPSVREVPSKSILDFKPRRALYAAAP